MLDQTVLQTNNYLAHNLSTLISLIVLFRHPLEFFTSLYFSITIPIVIYSSSDLLVTSGIRTKKLNYTDYWTKHYADLHHQNVRKEFLTPHIVLEMLLLLLYIYTP